MRESAREIYCMDVRKLMSLHERIDNNEMKKIITMSFDDFEGEMPELGESVHLNCKLRISPFNNLSKVEETGNHVT